MVRLPGPHVGRRSRARAARGTGSYGAKQDGRSYGGAGDGEGNEAVVARLMSYRIAVCGVLIPLT